MEREIKFRGSDGDRWYYGDLEYCRKTDIARIHTYNSDGLYEGQHIVDPSSVGQFTGMHDKYGKEIYEGDILKHSLSNRPFGVVTWHSFGYFYILESSDFNKEDYVEPKHSTLVFMLDCVDFEIVGNIYDNIDLIKINE